MDVAKTEKPSFWGVLMIGSCTEFIRSLLKKSLFFFLMKSYSYLEATYVVGGGAHGNVCLFFLMLC